MSPRRYRWRTELRTTASIDRRVFRAERRPCDVSLAQVPPELLESPEHSPAGWPLGSFPHWPSYAGLPGRPVTADLDVADPRTFGFPDSLAPYVPFYRALCYLGAVTPYSCDVVPLRVERIAELHMRSPRWVYKAFRHLVVLRLRLPDSDAARRRGVRLLARRLSPRADRARPPGRSCVRSRAARGRPAAAAWPSFVIVRPPPVWDRGSPAAILCSCLTRPLACRFPIPRAESPSTAFCTRATELLGPGRPARRPSMNEGGGGR